MPTKYFKYKYKFHNLNFKSDYTKHINPAIFLKLSSCLISELTAKRSGRFYLGY